ncbi:TetR/AcrR family transcriptional regulator [bacterium]|nr:MAG: TetR/AcrR family transcriptional regulator [bacterium]
MSLPTANEQEPRKERERRRHEQEILEAARDLFARKGYYNTTLEEIAHHAQFGKGTIYNYFSSKEDLFCGILNGLLDKDSEVAESSIALPGSTREKLTAYAKAILSYSEKNADLFHMIVREVVQLNFLEQSPQMCNLRDHLHKTWEVLAIPLAQDVEAEQLKPFDAVHLAAIFDNLLRLHAMQPFRELFWHGPVDVDVMAQSIVNLFFEGIQQRGQSK